MPHVARLVALAAVVSTFGCADGASTAASASASASARSAPSTASAAPSASAPVASSSTSSAATGGTTDPVTRSTLAVRRVADDANVLSRDLKNLPDGGAFYNEVVPLGSTRVEVPPDQIERICGGGLHCEEDGKKRFFQQPRAEQHPYLRVVVQGDEGADGAMIRLQKYLTSFAAPANGVEWAFGRLLEIDAHSKELVAVGGRSYVVSGPSPLQASDIVDISLLNDDSATVVFSVNEDAGGRFEAFTRENLYRRIAFFVDGYVVAAPMITTPIPGGQISLVLAAGEKPTVSEKAEAQHLVGLLKVWAHK